MCVVCCVLCVLRCALCVVCCVLCVVCCVCTILCNLYAHVVPDYSASLSNDHIGASDFMFALLGDTIDLDAMAEQNASVRVCAR
jgi:hypothetical protein